MMKMESASQFIDDLTGVMGNIPIVNGIIQSVNENAMDSKFGIINRGDSAERLGITDDSISFRQIINRFNEFLLTNPTFDMSEYLNERKAKAGYPIDYLIFDYCLSALEGNTLDSKLYLAHAFYILGFKQRVNLLLSTIVYTALTSDSDIRKFLTLLASSIEPISASSHVRTFGEEYGKRYNSYREGLSNILNQK